MEIVAELMFVVFDVVLDAVFNPVIEKLTSKFKKK